ncbi:MAG: hypothetical protein IKV79_00685 [Oscillospiraceae bacterium]|nr:hypothetical protein [Oscillospiraceae bacterium]
MAFPGYNGQVLLADLSTKTYEIVPLPEQWAKDFLGGNALGARFLLEFMPPNTPVFAPESVVGFVGGVANNTKALMGPRYSVVSKSPVYGGISEANSGGSFAGFMRKSGFDAIFVKGISEKPVYLFVNDCNVEFRDASNLWGRTISEADAMIREELAAEGHRRVGVTLIGPAGERKSHMAAVICDRGCAAARGGSGAVIGSKNLKAVACTGTHEIQVVDPDALLEINKMNAEYKKSAPPCQFFPVIGTSGGYLHSVEIGDCSVHNWEKSGADVDLNEHAGMHGTAMDPLYKTKKLTTCTNCYIGCNAMYHIVDEELGLDFETYRPEYETLATFGSNIGNSNPKIVVYGNYIGNEWGLDTLSVGGTISWLMECYEKGIVSREEIDGIDLTWGNCKAIVEILKKIANNEGIGAILQNGSKYAAETMGKGFECLVTASGMELAQHGSRCNPAMGRTFQYDPAPGRHTRGGRGVPFKMAPPEVKHNYEDTGAADADMLWEWEHNNATGFCSLSDFLLKPGPHGMTHFNYIKAITGWEYTPEDVIKYGKRAYTVRHAFNLREGLRRKDFTLSDRACGRPPQDHGPLEGVTIDNEKLADNFFSYMGFDVETAVPSKETLENLGGLEKVIEFLYPEG